MRNKKINRRDIKHTGKQMNEQIIYLDEASAEDVLDDSEPTVSEAKKTEIKKKKKKQQIQKDSKKKGKKPAKSSKKKDWKKIGLIGAGVVAVLLVIYFGIAAFFTNHFYVNTEINGKNFSGKTVDYVKSYMKEQVKDYQLIIHEKDQKTDVIYGKDISLQYVENKDIDTALKKQNPLLWLNAFWKKSSTEVTIDVSYDKAALDQKISQLQSVTVEQIPAQNAYPKYNGTEFVVEPEVLGTAVNIELLTQKLHEAIARFDKEFDMKKEGCYVLPKYISTSKEVQDACNSMNQYLKASITYTMDENVVVDKNLISTWLSVDENMNVKFNENGVKEWLTAFGDKYDTLGGTRTITSPWGRTVQVSGGDYGWSIDEDTEYQALLNSIKNGEVVTKEPAYYQGGRAASHGPQDWGTTYAEVDIAAQHMWLIVNGAVAMESDVVTGVPNPAKATTPGVFFVKEMQRNATLVGAPLPGETEPEYRTPVSFWMRVTWSGIGFHDATWQSAFGGNRYAEGFGSHGCINMPYDKAAQLFELMGEGTPVIIHN